MGDTVSSGRFLQEHIVILFTVHVETVVLHRHEDRILKVLLVESVVVHRDLSSGSTVERVENVRIEQEHILLVLFACYLIVDVRELPSL